MKKPRLLVVDQPAARAAYEPVFAGGQLDVFYAASPSQALEQLAERSFDVVIAAHDRPAFDAIDLVERIHKIDETLPVIVVDAHPNMESAQASLRAGAGDYLSQPLIAKEFLAGVGRLVDQRRRAKQWVVLEESRERTYGFDEFLGGSIAMRRVFETIEQIANLDVDVLVHGETGTGKELVARSIHRRSRRAEKPFVPVDCGAIPENLLESEFFGHERGAFTGAEMRRIGLLEFAEGGTFFLDELGELPLVLQSKLLRSLQERKIRRVGGREELEIDIRVIAATSRDLQAMIRQEQFREDLYYRINVVRIDLPPLRLRGDDLGLLAERFIVRYGKEMGKQVTGVTPEAFQVMRQYDWPGNVRELQNVIRRSIALAKETLIGLNDLPDSLVVSAGEKRSAEGFFQLRELQIAQFERDYLSELLKRHRGNVKTAATEAKLPRGTLYRIMKNHGLDSAEYR